MTAVGSQPIAAAASWRSTVALAAGAAIGVASARVLTPHAATHGPVICPFRLITGLPCPGCGMTRAWVYLMHGDVAAAVSANPFSLVALPAAAAFVLAVALALVRRQSPPEVTRILPSRLIWPVAGAWIVFGVVRAVGVATGHASA
jgi:hypothetical protein